MSSVDAAEQVNEVLASRFGMKEASLDVREVTSAATSVFLFEVMSIVLNVSELPLSLKRRVLQRVVSRAYPNREGVTRSLKSTVENKSESFKDNMRSILEEMISSEHKHFAKKAKRLK